MKRSDMIKGMALNIGSQSILSGVHNELGWLNLDELLTAIENAGMMPPAIYKTFGEEFNLEPDGIEYNIKSRIRSFIWEDEDE